VIAGAGRRDFFHPVASEIHGEGVESATRLERTGWQVGFDLQVNRHTGPRQGPCRDRSRDWQVLVEQLPCFVDDSELRKDIHCLENSSTNGRSMIAGKRSSLSPHRGRDSTILNR
jgi:hypothetical protein